MQGGEATRDGSSRNTVAENRWTVAEGAPSLAIKGYGLLVPTYLVAPNLPFTPRGKIDRKALANQRMKPHAACP